MYQRKQKPKGFINTKQEAKLLGRRTCKGSIRSGVSTNEMGVSIYNKIMCTNNVYNFIHKQ